jgi:hypothetical protein
MVLDETGCSMLIEFWSGISRLVRRGRGVNARAPATGTRAC